MQIVVFSCGGSYCRSLIQAFLNKKNHNVIILQHEEELERKAKEEEERKKKEEAERKKRIERGLETESEQGETITKLVSPFVIMSLTL